MLNWWKRNKKLVLVVLFGLSILLLLSLLEPGYSEICRYYEHPDRKECASHNLVYVAFWHVANAIDAAGVAITGIATVLLAWITWRLVSLGTEQSKTTRAQLRAYVLVDEGNVRDFAIGQHPKATIWVKNYGQTPAYGVKHNAIIGFFPVGNVPDFVTGAITDPETVMGPGSRQSITPVLATQAMTAGTLAAINAGTHALYIDGDLRYVDCFGVPQRTTYRVRSGGPQVDLGAISSEGAPHNTAT